MRWRRAASSSTRHRSLFLTGRLSAIVHPRFFQLWIHSVMPVRTYSLSVNSSTSLAPFNALSASITAVSSIRLLVVPDDPPCSSLRCRPLHKTTPQPPGPSGFRLHAPAGVDLHTRKRLRRPHFG